MTDIILEVEHHRELDMRVELRLRSEQGTPDPNPFELEATPYVVRLVSAGEHADEPFSDELQARAHFRTVCQRALGITPAYTAPTFATPMFGSPEEVALDFYSRYHARLTQAGVGSEQTKALMREMIDDPAFAEHIPEILQLCGTSSDWVNAMIRTICRRIRAIETAVTKADIESVPGFGVF